MCESGLAIYRKELLRQLSDDTQCDDLELTKLVVARNYRAIYDPRVFFYENQEKLSRSRMLSQKLRRGRANIHCLFKTIRERGNRFSSLFTHVILPFEFFLHVIAPVLFCICLVSLPLVALSAPLLAVLGGVVPAIVALALGSWVMWKTLPPKRPKDTLKMAFGALSAFVEFNLILFVAFLLVAAAGPRTYWRSP